MSLLYLLYVLWKLDSLRRVKVIDSNKDSMGTSRSLFEILLQDNFVKNALFCQLTFEVEILLREPSKSRGLRT